MQESNAFRVCVRSMFRRVFHLLLDWLGIRRFKEHSFFATLLGRPAAIADFGAHRGEFFAALKSEYSISRALLIEANPGLAEPLKEAFGEEADVVHAALVGGNNRGSIIFTRSTSPESSSIFREWAVAHRVADQVDVPAMDLAQALRRLGGRVDLAKLDIESAEVEVLQTARSSDLAACSQFTAEFHDTRPPITRSDVDRVCQRMRSEGYGVVNANWPYFNDVLFVNLRSMPAAIRMAFRCRIAIANALFITRRTVFGSGYSLFRQLSSAYRACIALNGTNCPCTG
jgi:FkbM family methyltransferase